MDLDFFGLFDYAEGDTDTYEYSATEFNEIYRAIVTTGVVHNYLDEMEVSINGLTVSVAAGGCFINGRYGKIEDAKQLTLDAASTQRTDTIVLRLDVPNRKLTLEVKQGSTTLTQNENIYELALAEITIPANSVETTMVDKRSYYYSPTEAVNKLNAILAGTETVYARYA